MIPKIIHYCWFGNAPLDKISEQCIKTWEFHMPDFEIKRWDEENFDFRQNDFALKAYENKYWPFVSDFARVWIIKNFGGIYLDTDMYVIESLEKYLDCTFFIGCEREDTISCGIFGAVKNHYILNEIIDYYTTIQFDTKNKILIPSIFTLIFRRYGFTACNSILKINNVNLYPAAYFYPLSFENRGKPFLSYITHETSAIHLWAERWKSGVDLIREGKLWKGFTVGLKNNMNYLYPIRLFYLPINILNALFYKSKSYFFSKKKKKLLKELIRKFISPLFMNIYLNKLLDINPVFFAKRRHYLLPYEGSYEGKEKVRVKKRGIIFNLDLNEHNAWRIFYGIFYEGTYRLFSLIRKNFNIIDVGANVGYYTLNFARKSSDGTVYAFEPDSYNHNLLKENITLNSFNNIKTFEIALGSSESYCDLEVVCSTNRGMNRVVMNRNGNIKLAKLDDLHIEFDLIHLIKVDIEGFEHNFLRGAKKIILKDKPILFIEFCDVNLKKYGSSALELYLFISKELHYNYVVHADTMLNVNEYFLFEDCFFDALCFDDISLIEAFKR